MLNIIIIIKKFGKQVTLKDVQNIRTKLKSAEKNGCNDAQVLVDRLKGELQCDKDARGGIIVNQDDQVSVVYYSSSHLQLFEKFPKVMMIDGTYNVNRSGMPLYSFMVEDGYGHGRTVFYAATANENTECISAIVKAFKSCNPSHNKVKVIIIDEDFTELAVLREEMPSATILFCQFHVIQNFYKVVSNFKVPKENRNDLWKVLHDIVYSKSEEEFRNLRAEICCLGNQDFEKYFLENYQYVGVIFKRSV